MLNEGDRFLLDNAKGEIEATFILSEFRITLISQFLFITKSEQEP